MKVFLTLSKINMHFLSQEQHKMPTVFFIKTYPTNMIDQVWTTIAATHLGRMINSQLTFCHFHLCQVWTRCWLDKTFGSYLFEAKKNLMRRSYVSTGRLAACLRWLTSPTRYLVNNVSIDCSSVALKVFKCSSL